MKNILISIILIFYFMDTSKANDIKDFQIEGMSIGDSLLDFFDEKEIQKEFYYKNDKYYAFASSKYKSENYDGIQFHIKKSDRKYKIEAIEGMKAFEGNFNECLKFKDIIVKDIKKGLENPIINNDEGKHTYDTTGESKYYRTSISLNPEAEFFNLSISCIDWSKKLEPQFADKLAVSISSDEFNKYMNYEAY